MPETLLVVYLCYPAGRSVSPTRDRHHVGPSAELRLAHRAADGLSWRRLVLAGLAAAAAIGLAGGALEWWWFGASDRRRGGARRASREGAVRRDGRLARGRFAESIARDPAAAAAHVGRRRRRPDALRAHRDGAPARGAHRRDRRHRLRRVVRGAGLGRTAVRNSARAGRGPKRTLFVTRSPLGPAAGPRAGDSPARTAAASARSPPNTSSRRLRPNSRSRPAISRFRRRWRLPRSAPPRSLRRHAARRTRCSCARRPVSCCSRPPSRHPRWPTFVPRWRRRVAAMALLACGVTLLLLDWSAARSPLPRHATSGHTCVRPRARSLCAAAGGLLIWLAFTLFARGAPHTSITLVIAGFTVASIVALLAGPAARLRVAFAGSAPADRRRHHPVRRRSGTGRRHGGGDQHLLPASRRSGSRSVEALISGTSRCTRGAMGRASCFLLASWRSISRCCGRERSSSVPRWARGRCRGGAYPSVSSCSPCGWRPQHSPRRWRRRAAGRSLPSVSSSPLLTCGIVALGGPRIVTWYRRTTVASRILALFVAFLLPSLLLYPCARLPGRTCDSSADHRAIRRAGADASADAAGADGAGAEGNRGADRFCPTSSPATPASCKPPTARSSSGDRPRSRASG